MQQLLWTLLYRLGRYLARMAWAELLKRAEPHAKELNMPRTLNELQTAVGDWSKNNFGNQQSKAEPALVLGSLAPLLGVGEEIGELAESTRVEDQQDALSDIVIYLCDYAVREGFDLSQVMGQDTPYSSSHNNGDLLTPVVSAYGKLLRATLKRHQGIKGMDNFASYAIIRRDAVSQLYLALSSFAWWVLDTPLILLANDTWDSIVSKRDWKKDAATGGNHSHELPPKEET